MFEEAPTWTPKEPLHFHFFNHLESSRDLRWGFMSNLFQGVSSKMDVLKVPLRFNTESEKQNFLQRFSFSFLPLFLTQEVNKFLVLISPCMDLTIFKHFPRRTILSGTIKPPSARRDVPAGWSSATGGRHFSSLVTVTLTWPRCCRLCEKPPTLPSPKLRPSFPAAQLGTKRLGVFFVFISPILSFPQPFRSGISKLWPEGQVSPMPVRLFNLARRTWRNSINRK